MSLGDRYLRAVQYRNLKELDNCIKKGVDPNIMKNGESALHIAAEKNDMYLLLKLSGINGIDINVKDSKGNTPLIIACKNEAGQKLIRARVVFYLIINTF